MIRLLAAALLMAAATQAQSQPAPQPSPAAQQRPDVWTQSGDRFVSRPARVSLPQVAGTLTVNGSRDLSRTDDGSDSALQYRSADGQIIGTVFVYYPGLPHAGLAAYATDRAIHTNSRSPVRVIRAATVAAGATPGAAIRIDYENYLDGASSSAAFVKAGRWIVKLRVTGPGPRAAEVMAAMDALLRDIAFDSANAARPAAPLTVTDCPAGTGRQDARALPDPAGPELLAYSMIASFDGGGMDDRGADGRTTALPSRVPSELCFSGYAVQSQVPILRAAEGPGGVDGRTRLLALLSDSGILIEVVKMPGQPQYVMLYHQIGSTAVLGSYDAVPSDRQIGDLIRNPQSDAGRIRVPVILKTTGETEVRFPSSALQR